MSDETGKPMEEAQADVTEQAQFEMQELAKLVQAVYPVIENHPGHLAVHLLAAMVAHQIYMRTGGNPLTTLAAFTEFTRDVGHHLEMSYATNVPVVPLVPVHPGAPEGSKAN